MGIGSSTQRIMTLEALESERITHASQDGSREFISLLACISALGVVLPPALIYRGEARILQDSWFEDFNPDDEAFFATSANGWSSDALGLNWLKQVFDRCTKKKAGNRRRLLIVDGHSSHVNMRFIEKCDELRILLLILPPHSTHRLQPLDVSLFSPLATYYTEELNQFFFNSLGASYISKRTFWSVFRPAWHKAFSKKNIESAWRKTGLFPFNPQLVLNIITKPPKNCFNSSSGLIKTPMTNRAVRHIHRAYQNAPSSPLLAKILRANERLASEHSIDQHIIRGLNAALRNEKKRRQRGKRLNMLGEEASGPQFYSPGKVQAARDRQTVIEAEKLQKQQDLEEKRALAAAAKQQKAMEKAERMKIMAEKKILNEQAKQAKLAEKQAQKKPLDEAIQHGAGHSSSETGNSRPQKNRVSRKGKGKALEVGIMVEEEQEPLLTTSRGRRVQRPRRLDT